MEHLPFERNLYKSRIDLHRSRETSESSKARYRWESWETSSHRPGKLLNSSNGPISLYDRTHVRSCGFRQPTPTNTYTVLPGLVASSSTCGRQTSISEQCLPSGIAIQGAKRPEDSSRRPAQGSLGDSDANHDGG